MERETLLRVLRDSEARYAENKKHVYGHFSKYIHTHTFGRAIIYTTTTQRGWCIEAFVLNLSHLQSLKLLPGGGGV